MNARILGTRSLRTVVALGLVVTALPGARAEEPVITGDMVGVPKELPSGSVFRYTFERKEFPSPRRAAQDAIDWGLQSRAVADITPVTSNRFELRFVQVEERRSTRRRSTLLPGGAGEKPETFWTPGADAAPLTLEIQEDGRIELVSGDLPRDTGANRAIAKLIGDLGLVTGVGIRGAVLTEGGLHPYFGVRKAPAARRTAPGGDRRPARPRGRSRTTTKSHDSLDLVYRGRKLSPACKFVSFAVSSASTVNANGKKSSVRETVGSATFRESDGFLESSSVKISGGGRFQTGAREFSVRLESVTPRP